MGTSTIRNGIDAGHEARGRCAMWMRDGPNKARNVARRVTRYAGTGRMLGVGRLVVATCETYRCV